MKNIVKISLSLLLVLLVTTGCASDDNINNTNKIEINEDGGVENDILYEEVTFSDISFKYENGITTLTAYMINNTENAKTFTVKIKLNDDDGNTINELTHQVENLTSDKRQLLQTGIVGDYSYVKNVEFEIVNQ